MDNTDNYMNVCVNDFVIVNYEGANWPGKVTEVDKEGAKVSTLTKCRKGWRWLLITNFKIDKIDYKFQNIKK